MWLFKYTKCSAVFFCFILAISLQFPEEPNFFVSSWQTISNQRWDELTKSWVITTLKAPASIITKDVIDKLGLAADNNNGMGGF